MEIFLISIFSIIIIYITVSSIIKVLKIAFKRKEISERKHRLMVASSIVIGISIATALPFVYIKLFEFII